MRPLNHPRRELRGDQIIDKPGKSSSSSEDEEFDSPAVRASELYKRIERKRKKGEKDLLHIDILDKDGNLVDLPKIKLTSEEQLYMPQTSQ